MYERFYLYKPCNIQNVTRMLMRYIPVLLMSVLFLCSSCNSFYGNLVQNQVQQLSSLTTLLSQVNSKESADLIAPQMSQYGNGFSEAFKGLSSSGSPSYLEMYMMYSQLKNDSTKQSAWGLAEQLIRLHSANYYGSQTLKDSLYNELMKAFAS